jgi:hypothetical protein
MTDTTSESTFSPAGRAIDALVQPTPNLEEAFELLVRMRDRLRVEPTPGLTVDQFATGLSGAAWRMNLSRFCETLGWEEDTYAQEKFLDFQQLARLLGRFDNGTLSALLRSQGGEAVVETVIEG